MQRYYLAQEVIHLREFLLLILLWHQKMSVFHKYTVSVYPSNRHMLLISGAWHFLAYPERNGESDELGRSWIGFAERTCLDP